MNKIPFLLKHVNPSAIKKSIERDLVKANISIQPQNESCDNNVNILTVMGIESSCDDSCASILRVNFAEKTLHVVSDARTSQKEIHEKFGGVVPLLAKRAHKQNVPIMIQKSLKICADFEAEDDLKWLRGFTGTATPKTRQQLTPSSEFERQTNSFGDENLNIKTLNANITTNNESLVKKQNQINPNEIDAIFVTNGPGMRGCLVEGVSEAIKYGNLINKPGMYAILY